MCVSADGPLRCVPDGTGIVINFSIIGADRESGQEVKAVVPASDRQAAEQWAARSGILWTEITPISVTSDYAAEKDGVIWLIGALAIGLSLLILRPQLDLSNAAHVGSLLGAVIGAFIFIFLFGLIGAKLGGKSALRARLGFFVASFLVLALVCAGESRIRATAARQQDIHDVQQTAQALVTQIKSMAGTQPASSRPASVEPPDVTIHDLNASELAETKLLMNEMQKFVAESTALGQSYQKRISTIMGEGLIRPENLDTAEHLAQTKAKLAELRKLLDERDKAVDTQFEALPPRVNVLPINTAMKQSAIDGYYRTGRRAQELVHQIEEQDRNLVDAAIELAKFMEGRLGRFKRDDNELVFKDGADVKTYNAYMDRINQAAATENELTQKQQELMQESTAKMEQFLGK